MTALVSFDRVFEVLDAPGIAEKPARCGAPPAGSSSTTCRSATRRRRGVDRLAGGVATLDRPVNEPVLKGGSWASSPGRWWPWSAPPARASPRCPG